LRQQAARLSEKFKDPPVYVRELHGLFDFYSDRARRSGQSGRPGPLLQAYNVRPPVLRALLQEIRPQAEADRDAALALCDALWAEDYLEFRHLAAMLLGQVSPIPPEPILERLQAWITPNLELHLIETLLSTGVERLHREQPQTQLRLIQNWLENTRPFFQQLGLRALLPLIQDPAFENLPVFYRMIQPLCLVVSPVLRPDLLEVLAALAARSPQETAFFLRQSLGYPDAPDTPWLIRQSLESFPEEIQTGLRAAVRDGDRRPATARPRRR
jgi:hypothetical protein